LTDGDCYLQIKQMCQIYYTYRILEVEKIKEGYNTNTLQDGLSTIKKAIIAYENFKERPSCTNLIIIDYKEKIKFKGNKND